MILNEETFLLFAAKYYDNPNCSSFEEFEEDLNRIKYLKKLFYLYEKKKVLRERLIINHLIILYNVFEHKACTKMLYFRLKEYREFMFPFIRLLGYLPKAITDVEKKGNVFYSDDVVGDEKINEQIKAILKE